MNKWFESCEEYKERIKSLDIMTVANEFKPFQK